MEATIIDWARIARTSAFGFAVIMAITTLIAR